MPSLDILNFAHMFPEEVRIREILRTNEISAKYGLTLTAAEAKELIAARNQALQNHGRIELGIETLRKIIAAFCTSPFISQTDYPLILEDLQELFYDLKNETEDSIGDDELIATMKDCYDRSCEGSIELFKGTGIEELVKTLRLRQLSVNSMEGEFGREIGD